MPKWKPEPIWPDSEVFIIGGGDSLRENGFDFNLLKDEKTIGCNSAYLLGAEICDICIFSDFKFFQHFGEELALFGGMVITNSSSMQGTNLDWLWVAGHQNHGLHYDALGYNGNTGSSALNLAVLLGAKKVYLLGFDMKLSPSGRPNWHHNKLIDKPSPQVYDRFKNGFAKVKKDWKDKFPDREIYNVTDDSDLEAFPKISFTKFWKERTTNGMDSGKY